MRHEKAKSERWDEGTRGESERKLEEMWALQGM